MLDKQLRRQDMLVPHIARRLQQTGPPGELAARALVAAALACLDVAATAWTQTTGEQPLRELVDTAFAAVCS